MKKICECGHDMDCHVPACRIKDCECESPTPKEKVSECDCKCHRLFKEPTGCVPCVENHPRPAPSHLKEEPPTEKCELPKKCKVKDCHNGFITRYIGGSIDSEACPCSCHRLPKKEKEVQPKSEKKIELSKWPWEDDEYIIDMNGHPVGTTLSSHDADIIIRWWKTAAPEINKYLSLQ